MKLQSRDRRALVLLLVSVALILIFRRIVPEDTPQTVGVVESSMPAAQKRLARLQKIAAELPALERASKELEAQLAEREKRLIQAETAAQAQAQLVTIFRRIAAAQQPPIEVRSSEVGQTRPLGEHYAEVSVPVNFVCRIEQLVNLLADITAQPEWLSVGGLRVSSADPKEKMLNVRLVICAAAQRKILPQKRGSGLL